VMHPSPGHPPPSFSSSVGIPRAPPAQPTARPTDLGKSHPALRTHRHAHSPSVWPLSSSQAHTIQS
jgi:hypothetical protein